MTHGTIKKPVIDRGFGFILPTEGQELVFHRTDVFRRTDVQGVKNEGRGTAKAARVRSIPKK